MSRVKFNIAHGLLISVISLLTARAVAEEEIVQHTGMSLDIDGLYRTPSLVGTKPALMTWSPDSAQLAFAWNDQGGSVRGLWVWQKGMKQPRRLTGADKQQAGISDLAWLDEQSLAYVRADEIVHHNLETTNVRVMATADRPRQLSISPDGSRLAFVTGEGLFLIGPAIAGSKPERVYALNHEAVRINGLQWSANSSRLAFLRLDARPLPEKTIHYSTSDGQKSITVRRAFPGEKTARYDVGVLDISTGETRILERPDSNDYIWNFGISSDAKQLFINGSDLLIKHHQVDVYELDTGKREVFYQEHDPLHLRPDWRVAWAPDNQGLVILTDRDGYLHLYHQPGPAAKLRRLTSGSWEISRFWVQPNGQWIYFLANRSHLADKSLYRVPFSGGEPEQLTSGHGTHQPVFSPDLQNAVSLYSNDELPHDLFHLDLDRQSSTRITRSPHADFYQQEWAKVKYVNFHSRLDGTELVGRLSVPPDFDPNRSYPLIVGSVYSDSVLNQWGGRQSHPTWGLDQYLVAQGYILLNVNIRGSWGQGREHNQGQRYGYGIVDIEDLHSGVEFLVRQGVADPGRVGIWGSSYGGLMTTMSLFQKPGIYAAGIAGAPATNVAHAYPGQMWVMGESEGADQPERYQSQSPLYHAEGLQDPLMFIHGTKDQVVLYSDTMALVERLVAMEKPFEMVTLPGVGHGWDNEAPEVRRFSFKKMVEFFNRHLQTGRPAHH